MEEGSEPWLLTPFPGDLPDPVDRAAASRVFSNCCSAGKILKNGNEPETVAAAAARTPFASARGKDDNNSTNSDYDCNQIVQFQG